MGLHHHQHCNDAEHQEIGQNPPFEFMHVAVVLLNEHGEKYHHCKLHNLRGLEDDGADFQPPCNVGIRRLPHKQYKYQHNQCGNEDPAADPEFPEGMVIKIGGNVHHRQTYPCHFQLLHCIIGTIHPFIDGGSIAGGKHHQDSDGQQNHHNRQEGQIHIMIARYVSVASIAFY